MIIAEERAWHTIEGTAVAESMGVDPAEGLTTNVAAERLRDHGPNRLADAKKESPLQSFARQYKNYMQIILVGAALMSLFIGDVGSFTVLILLTLFNASLGMHQESKAEDSLAALQKMMKVNAKVRREGKVTEISALEVVPGDVVTFEAGDRVPADGRLIVSANLEIEESSLTGESAPVAKSTRAIDEVDSPLGDREGMAYMNTQVTRGRGEMVATSTGMDTEVGGIAEMLGSTVSLKTPLLKQIDHLTLVIAALAGFSIILIIIIGLYNGEDFHDLYVTGIALAVAAIPTGLPLVVTIILVMGTMEMAERNAIIKRLPSVETLGSTSAICSDKTGTLTMNQMTVREMAVARYRFDITGQGYSTDGRILHEGGAHEVDLDPFLMPMALCSDATLQGEDMVGDPTEGALVVLVEKGGICVDTTRDRYPRLAEVPFDSEYKFMATFHEMTDGEGVKVIRCYVKGAPDVLISLASTIRDHQGIHQPVNDEVRQMLIGRNEEMARKGLRVLVVAEKDLDPTTFDPSSDLLGQVRNLNLLAMVGIVDPPRPEVKDAIAKCTGAGIRVRMITGDHAVTASAIADELGIQGEAITGKQLAGMTDEELATRLDGIGVVARVAPEHKVRMVKALQGRGDIVAMTGDGVNDAPALKKADIGVAMGITGSDVSKEASDMILTDDNFSTIVTAVEQGRIIYDNLLKFLRFQMANLLAFILSFVISAMFNIAGTALFIPVQIIFLNFFISVPLGIALGSDTPTPGLMKNKPRPANENIIDRLLWTRLLMAGLVWALITLAMYQWVYNTSGDRQLAQSASLAAFCILHIAFALNLRYPSQTIFQRQSLTNRNLLYAILFVFFITIALVESDILQRIFGTVSLTTDQWVWVLAVFVLVILFTEVAKFVYNVAIARDVSGS